MISKSDYIDEWSEFKESVGEENRVFLKELEERTAAELIAAKKYIPVSYLEESGLDSYDTEKQLLSVPVGMLWIAAYYTAISINSRNYTENGEMVYEAHILNTHLFKALLAVDFGVMLYHITCGLPIRVDVFFEDSDWDDTDKSLEFLIRKILALFPDVRSCSFAAGAGNAADEDGDIEADGNAFEYPWTLELDERVRSYDEEPDSSSYGLILAMLLKAMAEPVEAMFSVRDYEQEDGSIIPEYNLIGKTEGEAYLVLLTRPSEELPYVAAKPVLTAFSDAFDHENLTGLVINPYEESIVIDRDFIDSALLLFMKGLEYGMEDHDEI